MQYELGCMYGVSKTQPHDQGRRRSCPFDNSQSNPFQVFGYPKDPERLNTESANVPCASCVEVLSQFYSGIS